MSRKEIFILLAVAFVAVFCFAFFGKSLRQEAAQTSAPTINQNQTNNQKQNSGKNSGSIDLERPPFLDE